MNDFIRDRYPIAPEQNQEEPPIAQPLTQQQQQKKRVSGRLPPNHLGEEERVGWDGKALLDPHEPIGGVN